MGVMLEIRVRAHATSDAVAEVMLNIRFATRADFEFVGDDGYIPSDLLLRKIDAREVIVAEKSGVPLGYIRIEFLWSKLPYIALIRVLPDHRMQGIGRALLRFVEHAMYIEGHRVLLSSSQSNELEPQQWHSHMGFIECGRLSGLNEDSSDEIFFRKVLG